MLSAIENKISSLLMKSVKGISSMLWSRYVPGCKEQVEQVFGWFGSQSSNLELS